MFNIKALLKQVLNDQEILNLTADKKVYFLHALDPTTPYVEYGVYDTRGAAWAEDKEIAAEFFIQIDIFTSPRDSNYGDYTDIENIIKNKMIEAGFLGGHGPDLYEDETKLYHKPLRFTITKNNN